MLRLDDGNPRSMGFVTRDTAIQTLSIGGNSIFMLDDG
jgi:hypothetical protein